MNRYSKILHHIGPAKEPKTSESSSDRKRRTYEEYEEEQNKTEVDRLKEQTQQLTENIEFLQNLIVNQHDDVYELRQQLKSTPIPQPKENLTEGLLNEPPNIKNSDPLTPLDQNFVTLDQLNDHYQLFINRIQQQMATIGGGGETKLKYLDDIVGIATNPVEYDGKFLQYNHTLGKFIFGDGTGSNITNFVFVGSKSDLPPSVGGVINLEDNYTYFFTTTVDLLGDRLVAGDNTTILGGSSENCRIKSTGITADNALLSSVYSLPIRNITLEAPFAINLVASNPAVHALDWFGVNFTNCARVGIISSYNNFIMLDSAFLSSQDLTFDGTMGTIGFNQCLFTGDFALGGFKNILNFSSTLICRRRIRVSISSFVVPTNYIGIAVQEGVTFRSANNNIYNPESFILQTCNFSGPALIGGKLLNALNVSTHTDINGSDTFFEGNRGIDNTFVIGQYYMKNNATETLFDFPDTYTKIVGITTTADATNSKFTHTSNRLTYAGGIERQFMAQVSATVVASVSTNCSIAMYDSSNGNQILEASSLEFEALAGIPVVVHITDVHKHSSNDFFEVHISNLEGTDPVTVTSLNVLTTQLG